MPSCLGAFLSLHALADEFQQASGEIGPNNFIPLFFLRQLTTALSIQSFSSLPNNPSSPAWGFNPAIFKKGLLT